MNHLEAVVFDWAGTTVDHGSLCPVFAFQAAFSRLGLTIESWDVRRFMGTHKKEHLRAILALPHVRNQWISLHPQAAGPNEEEIDELFTLSEKLLVESVTDFAEPVPHLMEVIRWVRAHDLKVGSTSGYTKPMMEPLARRAAQFGYEPDAWVASDQVPCGRPAPYMMFRVMELLEVYPGHAVAKVGDAAVDIAEAHNAGAWGIGVVATSSLLGYDRASWEALDTDERDRQRENARTAFRHAGADFVIEDLSGLPAVLEEIDALLEDGARPGRAREVVAE